MLSFQQLLGNSVEMRMSQPIAASNKKISKGGRGPPSSGHKLPTPKISPEDIIALAALVKKQGVAIKAMSKPPLTLARKRGDFERIGDGVDRTWDGIKRLLNVERKCYESPGASVSPNQSGAVVDFTAAIAQGDTDATRDGDSIKVLLLRLNLAPTLNTLGSAEQRVKILIVQANDEAMSATQLNNLDGTAYSPLGHSAWDYKSQYRVLMDHVFVLDGEHQTHLERRVIKVDRHVQYNNATTTVNSGALLMYHSSGSASNAPTLDYTFTLEFVDN
jgi:hypothetical protein